MNKKTLFNKALAFGIIVLFVGTSVIPSMKGIHVETQINEGNQTPLMEFNQRGTTWYVRSGGGADFTKIQDAINKTSNGDTVYVYNGTYYENIIVNKSINLIGEDRYTTIIDGGGSGDVVYVSADWVNISGFTIQNSGNNGSPMYDAGIDIRSNCNIIYHNEISNSNYYGINFFFSTNNTISGNYINSNNCHGIYLYFSTNNTISSNYINSNNYCGISIRYSNSNNISNNLINSNTGEGIFIYHSSNIIILGNTITNNNYGIFLRNTCNYNILSGNNINSNNYCGIIIRIYFGSYCINNKIYHNKFINNTCNAYDECDNQWDNGYPSGGNYWDGYTGTDSDGDGIGDIPYLLPGGSSNQDLYPLGYFHPIADFTYMINDSTVLFDGSISIDPDGHITEFAWDFGDGTNDTGIIVTHTFNEYETYNVKLTVTDNDGKNDTISKNVALSVSIPDLHCEGTLNWINVNPGATVFHYFTVENIGESCSLLDWEINEYPDWGNWTFTPNHGNELTPEDGKDTIGIEVIAPDEEEQTFTGEIKIINSENSSDFCIIDVSLATPVSQGVYMHPLFHRILERYPNLFPILRHLLTI